MNYILDEELKLISLSKQEILILENLAKEFTKTLKSKGINSQIGGSLAKGTLIKKRAKQDIDIFAIFGCSEDIEKLEKVLRKTKLPGTLKKVHGSRDYFQINCSSAILEIIPVVKNINPNTAENITDVSLSHVKYIKQEIKKNPEISSQIKLSKAFCKANGLYGAEGYIKGFSGYSLEILTIHFGSFLKFLKGIQKVRVVDTMKYFKSEREVMTEINASKLNSPIIVVDPTYKYRNAVAGLGLETFSKFLEVSKQFLESPSLDFFKEKQINVEELKKLSREKKATLLEINLKTNRQEGDIAGTKMKKLLNFFSKELIRKEQEVLMKKFEYKSGQISIGYLIIKEKNNIEIKGPPLGLEEPIKKFKEANGKNVFKKNGYYWTTEAVDIEKILFQVKKVEKGIGAEIEIKRI